MSGLEGAGGWTSEVQVRRTGGRRGHRRESTGNSRNYAPSGAPNGDESAVSILRLQLTLESPRNAHKTTWMGVLLLSEMPRT